MSTFFFFKVIECEKKIFHHPKLNHRLKIYYQKSKNTWMLQGIKKEKSKSYSTGKKCSSWGISTLFGGS